MESVCGGADSPACSVCQDDLQDPTRVAQCGHVFCRSCLTQSLRIRPHCPLCRAPANEFQILPAPDVLAPVGRGAVAQTVGHSSATHSSCTQTAPRSRIRDHLQRHGTALPLMDPFATVSSLRLSSGMQELDHLLSHVTNLPCPSYLPHTSYLPHVSLLPCLRNLPHPSHLPYASNLPHVALLPCLPNLPHPSHLPYASNLPHVALLPCLPNLPHPSNLPCYTQSRVRDLFPTHQHHPHVGTTSGLPSPSSSYSSSSDEEFPDDMLDDFEMWQSGDRSSVDPFGNFNCPYCQQGGLDEPGLLEHCNTNHRADPRRVVCPICVSLPHGDPTYRSADFIGHINHRHRYYSADFMDVAHNDTISQQAAILASYNSLAQSS